MNDAANAPGWEDASGGGSSAADDISAGDAAVNIVTTSGNITIDAQANDADVIIKVDDNGTAVTAVTFDGSDEGNAIFVNDLKLSSDSAAVHWGANNEITLAHEHNVGLILTHTATGDNTPVKLTLKSEEDAIIDGEVIGALDFKGGDSGGTDAVLVCAGIEAVATDTHAADNNAAKLSFKTGASEAAAEKMALSSGGDLSIVTDGAAVKFGADAEVTLTHVHNTGLLLSDDSGVGVTKLMFGDAACFVQQQADGELGIDADSIINVTAPTVDIDASTAVTMTTPSVVIDSSADDKPTVEHKSTQAGANPPTLLFNHDSSSPADNDELGEIVFNGDDDGGTSTMMAKIVATSPDVTNSTEDGAILFKVRANGSVAQPCSIQAGGLTIGDGDAEDSMIIFDGNAQDFRIGIDDGTDTLEIGHGTAHGTNTGLTINASGDVTKIGQDTPSDTQVLTWDNSNSKVVWSDAGGGAQAKALTLLDTNNHPLTLTAAHGVIVVDTSGGAYQLNLPSSDLADGQTWTIKDLDGNASANNITIALADTTNDLIDGSATNVTINQDYGSVTFTQYKVGSNYHYLIL